MSVETVAAAVRSMPDVTPPENRTLGWQVLAWTRAYLRQPDGENAGADWVFTPEQARIVLRWYAVDESGRFVYRRGVLRRMKGWTRAACCCARGGGALRAVQVRWLGCGGCPGRDAAVCAVGSDWRGQPGANVEHDAIVPGAV